MWSLVKCLDARLIETCHIKESLIIWVKVTKISVQGIKMSEGRVGEFVG